ncbi:hypothetical protein KQX54_000422 [Cotesia glomerata]|uniref:Uncharacterized protein n=1 Tax=Cotesia glomerata TaxID=32391 RepID=A0AAV7IBK7_COTGL|nr:hypothetical protein KQX54_000422 [Cotesia glomerata]
MKKILKEIVKLEKYVLEELNVKEMTVTSLDKQKYGVVLRAEPDPTQDPYGYVENSKQSPKQSLEVSSLDAQLQEFLVKKEIVVNWLRAGRARLKINVQLLVPGPMNCLRSYQQGPEVEEEGSIGPHLDAVDVYYEIKALLASVLNKSYPRVQRIYWKEPPRLISLTLQSGALKGRLGLHMEEMQTIKWLGYEASFGEKLVASRCEKLYRELLERRYQCFPG